MSYDFDDDFENAPASADEPVTSLYPSSAEWFTAWLTPNYIRQVETGALRWCPQWWKHGEATSRIEALWRAWELARRDAGSEMSLWWLLHADPHMAALLDAEGCFSRCSATKGHFHREALPALPTDPGWSSYAS